MAYLATLIVLLPVVAATARFFSLPGDEEHRSKLWIQDCHASQVLCVVVVSRWCGFWASAVVPTPVVAAIVVDVIEVQHVHSPNWAGWNAAPDHVLADDTKCAEL